MQATLLVVQGHDVPVDGSKVRFRLDWLGMAAHGDTHTHVDALCHISYDGLTYNGRPANEVLRSNGATEQDVTAYSDGVVGRGVCCRWRRWGCLVSDSLQFEELVAACREEGRYEFMVVGLPGATGSLWNPIAIF